MVQLSQFMGEGAIVSELANYTNAGEGKKKCAFTLAEVLITLTILGVVAMLIVPNIMHRVQDRIAITRVNKVYSTLENAIRQMYVIEGYPESWDCTEGIGTCFFEKLRPYLNVKNTGDAAKTNIATYKTLKNNDFRMFASYGNELAPKILLNDGTYLYLHLGTPTPRSSCFTQGFGNDEYRINQCASYYGEIMVDINWKKKPNRLGYDVFFMNIYRDGIAPHYDNKGGLGNGDTCSLDTSKTWWDGRSCFDWILKHNNMDYKYRDVRSEW